MKALAYDAPIPGYKTKNAISLRLWEAKATAEDFNLFQFNDGQYESAAQLHARAQQVTFHSKSETIRVSAVHKIHFQRLNKERCLQLLECIYWLMIVHAETCNLFLHGTSST